MGTLHPDSRIILERAFQCAVRAADPSAALGASLRDIDRSAPALVLGAGKAAAAMAAAFAAEWEGPVRGFVVTRYGHGLFPDEDARGIEVAEAAHPAPDDASLTAGRRLLELARDARPGERLVCLISGGGSALAAAPLDGLSIEQKRDAASFLIRAGADIREINCVRKHLSGLKGGRLAAAARPASVLTLAISDVPGDDPADIASGPTVPDRTTRHDALDILGRYRYPRLAELRGILDDPALETPKPGDEGFGDDEVRVIATGKTALDAAEAFLAESGFKVIRLGDDLDGEAEALGREHARIALEARRFGAPTAILSGGETRVRLGETREGRGGRNLEYLAGLALELAGTQGICALAADTDGIDGNADHAGGIVEPGMLERGAARGVPLETMLARHDTYRFFDACDSLLRTGPTRTNVNDFRLILCWPDARGLG